MPDKEIKVPNIGEFKDVEIIEVLVSENKSIKKNDPIITIESDKSSVEIPSTSDGVIKSLKVKVGDKVSEGSTILLLDVKEQQSEKKETKIYKIDKKKEENDDEEKMIK